MGLAAAPAVGTLGAALGDEDWVVRHSLLAMAKLGPQAAAVVPSLGTCLRHQNRYVRA